MRHVKLILSESVPGLGEPGDLVDVKVGFARNYLLPRRKAILATEARVRQLEHQRRVVMEKVAKEVKGLESLRDRLQSVALDVGARVGEEGKLFGSITVQQIAEQLREKGLDVDRRKIALAEPIKTLGQHSLVVKLRGELTAEIEVSVEAEE